jgi:serine phosphatase RsbU (regulator of sigma subunit)
VLLSILLAMGAVISSRGKRMAVVRTELDTAAKIQESMLPMIFPPFPEREEFEIYASMDPAREVGGDFYDFFMVDDDHIALVVADVSGKGIPAALFMMQSKAVIKMEALSGVDPATVLLRANTDLSEKNDDDMFTTAWIGVLEISTGKLTYADAGHEKLALCHSGTWELPKKPNGAVALATFAGEDYEELPEKYRYRNHTVQLLPGDAVLQYTDGVTEATDAQDELFGEERLLSALADAPGASPEMVLPFVSERISAFVGKAPQFDDITMLGLRYIGTSDKAQMGENDEAR